MKQENPSESKEAIWIFHPFFKYAVGILLVLLIFFVFFHMKTVLTPIIDFISILFTPIIISFLIYYLLRPIVHALEGFHVPRYLSVLFIYVVLAILLVLFFVYLVPLVVEQVTALANTSIHKLEEVQESSQSFISRIFHTNFDAEIRQRVFNLVQQVTTTLSKNFFEFVGFIAHIAAILAVIPFVVFYLLKDDQDFVAVFLDRIPKDFGYEVKKILQNMDKTLSDYITGVVLVSGSLGILLFIGYLIIGLNYALVLSLIAIVFTTIPFLGPFLAISPAILVGLSQGSWMVVKVIITFVIIQQLESNILSPQIIGQRLRIHPLTLILLLLAVGSLYGLVGLILATPLYALAKVLIENIYKIYKLHYGYPKEIAEKKGEKK